jgi:hypothetical protein
MNQRLLLATAAALLCGVTAVNAQKIAPTRAYGVQPNNAPDQGAPPNVGVPNVGTPNIGTPNVGTANVGAATRTAPLAG